MVHTDEMKLCLLNRKIKADFLSTMKTNIEMEMNMTPMPVTFANALLNYRNTGVNSRFPDNPNVNNRRSSCRIQQASRGGHGHGRGGRSGGRGRGGRGRGNNGQQKRWHDEWEITGLNNSRMMVHPAYRFTDEQWSNIPEQVQQQLLQMRHEYQQQKR